MTDERRQRILEVAEALEAQGQVASNNAVYAYVMGHRGHVVEVLKERRAQHAAQSGGLLVADEDEPAEEPTATEAATLAEDLRQLEASYEAWHLALERLWEIEQDGPLSEAQYGGRSWLEYQLAENLRTKERLEGQLQAAKVTEAVLAGQQHHDAGVPEGQALALEAVQAQQRAAQLWQQLGAHFDDQQQALTAFRDGQGGAAFPWLAGGAVDAQTLFVALYGNDPRALDAFRLLMTPLTVGHMREALASCPRLQPFAPRAIRNYLQPLTEGTSHANGR